VGGFGLRVGGGKALMRMIYCSRHEIEGRCDGTLFSFDVHDGHLVSQEVLMTSSWISTGNVGALHSICLPAVTLHVSSSSVVQRRT